MTRQGLFCYEKKKLTIIEELVLVLYFYDFENHKHPNKLTNIFIISGFCFKDLTYIFLRHMFKI